MLGSIFKNISHYFHREFRWIDIGITHHKFFQDIILDGTCHFFQFGTLLQTSIDVECQNRQYSTVHGHGHRHLIQRNAIEEHLHILYRTDGYTCFSHIAHYPFMVGIIAAVCCQVECNRQALLSGSQVTAIKSIGFLSGRKACVLPDSPRTHGIHR